MMTCEELMDRTSTTTTRYDIWNEEVPEPKNYHTLINGGRHFKPPHLEIDNPVEALNRSTQQTLAEEDEDFKQLQKTQANISLWGLLMASYKTLSKPNRPSQSNPSPYNHDFP